MHIRYSWDCMFQKPEQKKKTYVRVVLFLHIHFILFIYV